MNLGFLPTSNIYIFDSDVGTFTWTDEQKTILNNDDLIIVDYELMIKEYKDATYTTTTTVGDDYIELIQTKVSGSDVPYFINKNYKLTFTSSTYTLEKIGAPKGAPKIAIDTSNLLESGDIKYNTPGTTINNTGWVVVYGNFNNNNPLKVDNVDVIKYESSQTVTTTYMMICASGTALRGGVGYPTYKVYGLK